MFTSNHNHGSHLCHFGKRKLHQRNPGGLMYPGSLWTGAWMMVSFGLRVAVCVSRPEPVMPCRCRVSLLPRTSVCRPSSLMDSTSHPWGPFSSVLQEGAKNPIMPSSLQLRLR